MGTALGTMPSTGGGRPPAGRATTPGGYLGGEAKRWIKNTVIKVVRKLRNTKKMLSCTIETIYGYVDLT